MLSPLNPKSLHANQNQTLQAPLKPQAQANKKRAQVGGALCLGARL